jgi:ankyrin repeat protein
MRFIFLSLIFVISCGGIPSSNLNNNMSEEDFYYMEDNNNSSEDDLFLLSLRIDESKDKAIKDALEINRNLNIHDKTGNTPLHLWLSHRRSSAPTHSLLAKFLQSYPAQVNKRNAKAQTPFQLFITGNEHNKWMTLELFELFLINNANIHADFNNKNLISHLMREASSLYISGHPNVEEYNKIIAYALQHNEIKKQVKLENSDKTTVLNSYINALPVDILVLLWSAGADPDYKIITTLNEKKPIIDKENKHTLAFNSGRSYLIYCLKAGHDLEVRILLKNAFHTALVKRKDLFDEALKYAPTHLKPEIIWYFMKAFFENIDKKDNKAQLKEAISSWQPELNLSVCNPESGANILHYVFQEQIGEGPGIPTFYKLNAAMISALSESHPQLRRATYNFMLPRYHVAQNAWTWQKERVTARGAAQQLMNILNNMTLFSDLNTIYRAELEAILQSLML